MKKNKGEKRFEIALERIHYVYLRSGGSGFTHSALNELVVYALTGSLSSEEPTWKPDVSDLEEIDFGKPKGIDFIETEFEKEWDKKHSGSEFFSID